MVDAPRQTERKHYSIFPMSRRTRIASSIALFVGTAAASFGNALYPGTVQGKLDLETNPVATVLGSSSPAFFVAILFYWWTGSQQSEASQKPSDSRTQSPDQGL